MDVFRGSFDGIDGSDYAIANERYKLIRRSGEEEFYDLVEDPYERVNLLERALPTQAQSAYEWLKSEVTDLRASEGAL